MKEARKKVMLYFKDRGQDYHFRDVFTIFEICYPLNRDNKGRSVLAKYSPKTVLLFAYLKWHKWEVR